MRFAPIIATTLCAAALYAAGTPGALAQTPPDAASAPAAAPGAAADAEREGPFVLTDRTLGQLLEQGFEIKGILGGAMILVQEAELYSCGLTPDPETLSYQPYFACSKLDEISPGR